MSTSRFIIPPTAWQLMAISGWSTAVHVRLFHGTITPNALMTSFGDVAADEISHADYAPQDLVLSAAISNGEVHVDTSNAQFNGGAPTTIGCKYAILFKGDVASVTGVTEIVAWCDGAVTQATDAATTQANPAVVTVTAHGWANVDTVCITDSSDTTLIGRFATIANATANTFELTGINTSTSPTGLTVTLINCSDTTEDAALADETEMVISDIVVL